ncbi:MAG: class I SAM-dependent methyltransferase [Planctomycetaceae bacterium]
MKRLTEQVHDILAEHLQSGDVVVDGTLGTGRDAVFLANAVGESGKVYAFDVQDDAMFFAGQRIESAKLRNIVCIQDCHSRMLAHLPDTDHGRVAAVVFNLGYLPGGDPDVMTQSGTSTAAIRTSYELLRVGGVLSVLAYVGHPGGSEEAELVNAAMSELPGVSWIRQDPATTGSNSPRVLGLQKQSL